MLQQQVTGECQYKIYNQADDPCFGCGFCTIDGNDYSAMRKGEKPVKL